MYLVFTYSYSITMYVKKIHRGWNKIQKFQFYLFFVHEKVVLKYFFKLYESEWKAVFCPPPQVLLLGLARTFLERGCCCCSIINLLKVYCILYIDHKQKDIQCGVCMFVSLRKVRILYIYKQYTQLCNIKVLHN